MQKAEALVTSAFETVCRPKAATAYAVFYTFLPVK
jgi:hypothetical protein